METTVQHNTAGVPAAAENTKISEVDGLQLEEAKKINTSLLSLSQVIFALTQGKRKGAPRFVPYRDSKLTRILQNSFGGNSRTAIVINCSPSAVSHGQTLSSLRFGDRCGRSGCACRQKTPSSHLSP